MFAIPAAVPGITSSVVPGIISSVVPAVVPAAVPAAVLTPMLTEPPLVTCTTRQQTLNTSQTLQMKHRKTFIIDLKLSETRNNG